MTVAVIAAFPALAHGVFLLDVTPLRLATAGVIGAAGAVAVELTHRSVTMLVRLRTTERPDHGSR
jgi:hypothetical protein